MNSIYLDYNATTPLCREAWEAMKPAGMDQFGNPASAHHFGRRARQLLESAREQIAADLDADPDEVLFTSGATEANNLAIFGLLGSSLHGTVLAAPIEHPCILEPLEQLSRQGLTREWLPVTPTGQVEQTAVLARCNEETRLITLMLANHETGALQPVRHIAKTRPRSIPIHCDAAQAVGKIPVRFHDLGVTSLSVSAHKFAGPKGIGLLLLRRGVRLQPRFFGGHQQHGYRPGTEPVALILGMAAALRVAYQNLEQNQQRIAAMSRRLLEQLQERVPPVVLNGPDLNDAERLPGTLNLSLPGCRADILLVRLDLAGVACSTGSACSSGSLLPSPVLRAMGVPDECLHSALRISLGPNLTDMELDEAADRICRCVTELRAAGGRIPIP